MSAVHAMLREAAELQLLPAGREARRWAAYHCARRLTLVARALRNRPADHAAALNLAARARRIAERSA
jgi:hypothetical protein